ncbi:hypothetical protein [Ktedonobacter robiniae]|uniref:Uncharacterized protein n=1 Tax=Ktedonobacter robiniae TaxID=2778365 RepID=A0ABQ3URY8_9CHLR|nr:hypothetical protein [Ktedonobacter robiniae]GHO55508.1 hypothetical protein KSB_39830 [Ktedonobacter robiniae]
MNINELHTLYTDLAEYHTEDTVEQEAYRACATFLENFHGTPFILSAEKAAKRVIGWAKKSLKTEWETLRTTKDEHERHIALFKVRRCQTRIAIYTDFLANIKLLTTTEWEQPAQEPAEEPAEVIGYTTCGVDVCPVCAEAHGFDTDGVWTPILATDGRPKLTACAAINHGK